MRPDGAATLIPVVCAPADRSRGMLRLGGRLFPCALGRGGVRRRKREGDGCTPAGSLRLVLAYWRPDRIRRPATVIETRPIHRDSGWCDDPGDRNYNRPVALPYAAGHERLWRDDRLYDICVVLDWNLDRPLPGAGSAVFLHLAAPDFKPTAGCIAVEESTIRRILAGATSETYLRVGPFGI
jgi:L,D-peptidoglycan transpeptidase YkuD (ErfK/YbiS/YcfS/YnhG family)